MQFVSFRVFFVSMGMMDNIFNNKMKRLYSILFMLLLFVCASAQKKEISNARDNIKKNRNLEQAEKSMSDLLKDSANRYNDRIWSTMFDAIFKQYVQGNEKLYLRQNYDTTKLFNLTMKMIRTAESLDSVDARPNKNGKIELKHRKKHADLLHKYRPNLYNGGLFFVNKQKYAEAYKYFDAYIDCANQPLFTQFDYNANDKRIPEAAYWAVYCGYKMKDPKATFHHTYLALKDTARYCMMLQYLAETYRLEKDTVRYIETLTEGFEKYPTFEFFFPRLVQYYGENGRWETVLDISERAISNNPESEIYRLSKGTALLNLGKYDECIAISDELIAENDSLADAYYDAGMAYFQKAVELDKNIQLSKKQKNKIKDLYHKALPYMKCYRALAPDQRSKWGLTLYTIYLNLNMGDEFDEIDRLLREKH